MTVALENTDDGPVRSLAVAVDLPEGWSVVAVEAGGTYNATARRLSRSEVAAGERVRGNLTVRVPEDAALGRHRVDLAATSEAHFVEADAASVRVRPPDATPTPTVVPGGVGGTPATDRGTSPGGANEGTTDGTGPGFGPVAGLAGVALAVVVARHRGRNRHR